MVEGARNRNAIRSQQLLQKALSELMLEKPFDKITVADVTRRADLSRGTFYAHYTSTADLLRDIVDDITDKLFEAVDMASSSNFLENPEPVIKMVSGYMIRDESLYRTLIGTSAADSFISYMKRCAIDRMLEKESLQGIFASDLEMRLCVTYVAGGLVDICCAWFRGEYGDASVEEVGDMAARLVRYTHFEQLASAS